jgi:hypothetical protein
VADFSGKYYNVPVRVASVPSAHCCSVHVVTGHSDRSELSKN